MSNKTKAVRFENSGRICHHGCNRIAFYQLYNKKWCCEPHANKCPAKKLEIREKSKGARKNGKA